MIVKSTIMSGKKASGEANGMKSPRHRQLRCEICQKTFLLGGRHHCRRCGKSVCGAHFFRPWCTTCRVEQGGNGIDYSTLPLPVLHAIHLPDTPLSESIFNALRSIAGLHLPGLELDGSIGLRCADGDWLVLSCSDGSLTDASRAPAADQLTDCAATLVVKSESVLSKLLVAEASAWATALALGHVRLSGSFAAAEALEVLLVRGEEVLRALLASMGAANKVSAETATLAAAKLADAEAKATEERRERVSRRSRCYRLLLRHVGTHLQVGSWLLLIGAALWVWLSWIDARIALNALTNETTHESAAHLTAAACATHIEVALYVLSSLIWLAGSVPLMEAAYPEAVLRMISTTSADVADTTRRYQLSPLTRYFSDSPMLFGSWLFLVGGVLFAFGSVAGVVARPWDSDAWIYLLLNFYFVPSMILLWYGSTPDALCENDGLGTCYIRRAIEKSACLRACFSCLDISKHLANDQMAGAWGFAWFMIAGVLFELVSVTLAPSLEEWFMLASSVPFALGALILSLSSYPETVNRAAPWADIEAINDELFARGLLGTGGTPANEASVGGDAAERGYGGEPTVGAAARKTSEVYSRSPVRRLDLV